MRIFKKSVYFLFESGSLDSPGGPSSNRRYSITGVLRRRVIMNFTSKGPAEAKSTITLRRIHLIRRPYAKRRGRRETMFDCPLSKTVKILDQRSCSNIEKWLVVLTFLLGSCPLRRGSVYRAIVATLGGGGSGTMEIGISDSSRKGAGMGWVPFMLIVGVSTRGRG